MEWKDMQMVWTREPKTWSMKDGVITITTEPGTDLWQRTYYGFRNDNAPVLQMKTAEPYFSFTVKTEFDTKHRYDQCGHNACRRAAVVSVAVSKARCPEAITVIAVSNFANNGRDCCT
jgi:hypothetical protein